jgi:membrane-bound metal-dependent hydrolase YbcI (DUF457 family)
MLGHTHALSGAATGAATAEYVLHLPAATIHVARVTMHLPGAGMLALAVLTACFAVLPDLDKCGSCPARALGFFSEAFAWLVGKVSGGHRHATHSAAGVAAFTAAAVLTVGAWAAWTGARWGLGVFLALAFAAGLRALRLGGHHADLAGIAVAVAVTCTGWGLGLVPLACGLGCSTHIAGDSLTDSGVPLLWPFTDRRFRLLPEPLAFTTGTRPETRVVTPALMAALGLLTWHAATIPGFLPGH